MKTYEVTAENLVDSVTITIVAQNAKEALSRGRKKIHAQRVLSRYFGRVTWTVKRSDD